MSPSPALPAEPFAAARRAAVAQAVRAGEDSPGLQRLVRTAARVLHVPVAMVSLIAADREIIQASVGLPEPWASLRHTPLSHSLCAQVVRLGGPVILFDARSDETYREHAAVVEMGAGAYAGYPLEHHGHTLGAFCAADFGPRRWSGGDLQLLEDFAALASGELTLRIGLQELQESGRQLEERHARLLAQSSRDVLTGVANRRRFDERLGEEVARLQRHPGDLALVLVRVDGLRELDDRAGRPARDAVLAEVAARTRSVLRRRTDLIARLGDEFAVLLPGAGARDGEDMARRVRDVVAQRPVAGEAVTVSTGTATYLPSRGATQFYADADAALHGPPAHGDDPPAPSAP
ncbi:sensor domain-containing diguanylate cyclase [Kineococcus rubinsiae]|uniref:sensor domain-containing diguanylate cyclase n=1 Tax=Kineococcus rubinsiae TaxID=2609562 RepID=UPI00143141B5|nr:diguanylate cyclase [Kineococcus rubinsiae]